MSRVSAGLQRRLRARARGYCEYCQVPEAFCPTSFEADHVIPEQHGGPTTFVNLAWACFVCNRHKLSNLAGIDPKTVFVFCPVLKLRFRVVLGFPGLK